MLCINTYFAFAQQLNNTFLNQINTLKNKDDFSEYIYVHLDEFAANASTENLVIFEKLELDLWRNAETKNEKIAQLYFYINYAYQLKEFGFINKSINYYEKAFAYFKKNSLNYNIVEYCLKPLANNYTRLGDLNRAEDILKVTIEKVLKLNNEGQLASAYLNLAAVYRAKGAFKEAINLLNMALLNVKTNEQKAKINSDIAINFLMLGDCENSKKFVNISKKSNLKKDVTITIRNLNTLGSCFLSVNEFDLALKEFENALWFSKKYYGANNREVAKIYNSIGETYSLNNEFQKALSSYQKSLITLLPDYKPKSIYENPKSKYFYPENTIKEALDGRAKMLVKLKKPFEAIENYELSFLIENELRSSYLSQNSKLLQQQENRLRSEKCIDLCYTLFEQTKNIEWIKKAFYFSEQTKSRVLLENKELSLLKSSFKNDSLFIKENELLLKKGELNTNITLEQLKGDKANLILLAKLTSKRENVFNKLHLIKQDIDKKFPSLKTDINKIVTVKKLKDNILKKEQLLMEFFDGEKFVYIFSVSNNKPINLIRIEKNSELINELSKFISMFSSNRGSDIQNNIETYKLLANKLYSKLFKTEIPRSLIIIPDGIFSFVPFDALLTERTDLLNFEKLPYLLNVSTISYSYSASILLNDSKKINKKQNNILGFFPVFKNNHRELTELSFTAQEAKTIEKETTGKFLIYEDALKKAFLKIDANHSILHLSTHASAGSYFVPPAIEFYDETMYLPEIYGQKLDLDLVVLSACETGIGTLRKGEGVMSLARGFSFAGVKNLIVSLWKVNDKSTQQLMAGFYKNYAKNNNKSSALHQSKLDYLKNKKVSSVKKSPYYWASFVFIGENQLNKQSNNLFLWLLLVPILLFVGYFLFKKH